jgi:hypothetical protein
MVILREVTMHSYLVTMLDELTGEECRIIVQSSCPSGMQEFVEGLAREGKLSISCPVVMDVDERIARHVPVIIPQP